MWCLIWCQSHFAYLCGFKTNPSRARLPFDLSNSLSSCGPKLYSDWNSAEDYSQLSVSIYGQTTRGKFLGSILVGSNKGDSGVEGEFIGINLGNRSTRKR